MNDIGISVIAERGDALLARGITSTEGLVKAVPGLTAAETPYGTPVLTLRGVGFYESSLAGTSPVAAYLDEIPLPYTRMAQGASLDLQRVEVLKGPQGTLYGQNSTGGAINFIANKPTETYHAGFDASIGRFMDTDVQGFVSGPVTSNLTARIAVRSHQSDDWQRSVSRDDTMGATHLVMGRFLADWRPSSGIEFQLNVNGFIDKSDSQALAATSFFPNNPAAVQPAELLVTFTPPGDNRLADWDADKQFDRDNSYYQAALRSTIELAPEIDLIAITAYQHFRQDQFVDADGTNAEAASSTQSGYIKSFSQEVRLQGRAAALRYVVGGNYSRDRIYDNTLFIVGDGSQAHGVPGYDVRIGRTFSNQQASTYAAFANADLDLGSGLSVQGGARYTRQKRDFSGCFADPGEIDGGRFARLFSFLYGVTIPLGGCTTLDPATGRVGLVERGIKEDNVSWRGAVNWKPTRDTLLYASVSRGYKQGSYPTVGGNIVSQYDPARQESVLAYEAGAKISLLDRRVQINTALFYYDYSDKQLRGKVVDPVFGTIERLFNIPKSRVQGAELQITTTPVAGLSISGNATYSDSRVRSRFENLSPIGLPIDLRGESFELTPKWTVIGNAEYDTPVNAALNAFAGVDVSYQSESHGGYGGDPLFRIAPYTLVDLRAGIRHPDGRWRGQVFVRNLTNKYYWTNANYLAEFTYRQAGRPRTWGLSVSYRY